MCPYYTRGARDHTGASTNYIAGVRTILLLDIRDAHKK